VSGCFILSNRNGAVSLLGFALVVVAPYAPALCWINPLEVSDKVVFCGSGRISVRPIIAIAFHQFIGRLGIVFV
jgi:hypothetical protein